MDQILDTLSRAYADRGPLGITLHILVILVAAWLISLIVSALSFGIGFLLLYVTGFWAKLWQWADAPFMLYLAILLPVLVGFSLYGLVLALWRIVRRMRSKDERQEEA